MASHKPSLKVTEQNLVDLLFEAELVGLYEYVERLVFEDTNLVQEAFHNKEKTGNDDGPSKSGQYSKQSIKMMSLMGWREGQGLGAKKTASRSQSQSQTGWQEEALATWQTNQIQDTPWRPKVTRMLLFTEALAISSKAKFE